jgi:hypothetical protein
VGFLAAFSTASPFWRRSAAIDPTWGEEMGECISTGFIPAPLDMIVIYFWFALLVFVLCILVLRHSAEA